MFFKKLSEEETKIIKEIDIFVQKIQEQKKKWEQINPYNPTDPVQFKDFEHPANLDLQLNNLVARFNENLIKTWKLCLDLCINYIGLLKKAKRKVRKKEKLKDILKTMKEASRVTFNNQHVRSLSKYPEFLKTDIIQLHLKQSGKGKEQAEELLERWEYPYRMELEFSLEFKEVMEKGIKRLETSLKKTEESFAIERLIHYTSRKNWVQIKKEGVILPKALPIILGHEVSERVKGIIGRNATEMAREGLCLVGIPPGTKGKWEKYGLLKYIIAKKGTVKLSIPILHKDHAFVRDHALISPLRFKQLVGKDLWKESFEGRLKYGMPDNDVFLKCANEYLESTVLLSEYDGSYKVPELWVRQITPIELVQVLQA